MHETPEGEAASTSSHPHSPTGRPLIIGVGGSAGGFEALQLFLRSLPIRHGLSVVVILHRSDTKSLLPELLAHCSALPVHEATDGERLRPDHLYTIPGHTLATVNGGILHLLPAVTPEERWRPIDHFFHSLAKDQGDRAVAVVLSGSGTDGTLGLKSVSAAGGLAMVQDPASARHESMPQSALESGIADSILPPAELAAQVVAHASYLATQAHESDEALHNQVLAVLPQICEELLKTSSHDFKHYKPSTLVRRILRRIQVLRMASAVQYLELVATDRAEADRLFKEVLINVTAFFRDPEAFATLAREVLPKFFKNLREGQGVRVWVPGCATGEEAYTLAILLREQLDGMAEPPEVQIFASDIDEEALAIAREGRYPLAIAEQVSAPRLARFFTKKGKRFQVTKDIRDLVLFSVHNLIDDPPFSKLDLISCRNLLIYLGTFLQKKLIPMFHYALRPGGHLLLGPSENLNSYRDLFRTINAKHRISMRLPTSARPMGLPMRSGASTTARSVSQSPASDTDAYFLMERMALDEFAPRTLVVDQDGRVVCASGNLDKYLTVTAGAYQNSVTRLARTGLRMGLRAALSAATKTRRRSTHDGASLRMEAGVQRVRIVAQPLSQKSEEADLYFIAFQDIGPLLAPGETAASPTSDESMALIEQLERELASSRNDLERSVQDQEAANEEMKASNEELLSMNEELQSANEELETSKDEVQAANESLGRANTDLENLLASTHIATLFLDTEGNMLGMTPASQSIYNIRPTDLGRPLTDYAHRAKLMPPLPGFAEVSGLTAPLEDEVEMCSGTWYLRRVLPYRTREGTAQGVVLSFIDVTGRKQAEAAMAASEQRYRALADSIPGMLWAANAQGVMIDYNQRWDEYIANTVEPELAKGWKELTHPDDVERVAKQWQHAVATGEKFAVECRLRRGADGQYRWHAVEAIVRRDESAKVLGWFGTCIDIEGKKQIEEALRVSESRFRLTADFAPVLIWTSDVTMGRTWFNKPWLDFIRRPMEALVGKGWAEDIHPDDSTRCLETYATSCEERKPFSMVYRLRRHDGKWRYLLDNGMPLFQTSGEFTGYIGSCTDITTQVEAEEALREADERKNEFLATLAHELRNPLAPIRTGLQFLKMVENDSAVAERTREMMERQVVHMVRLIDDLLDVARITRGKVELVPERLELRRVLESALEAARPALDAAHHKMILKVQSQEIWVQADAVRLAQAVGNLLNNAAKFTPEGGRIELVAYQEGTQVVIQVSDNGLGIPAPFLPRIFDMFAQAKRTISHSQGGLGIGLSLVRRLVELHGGTVEVSSAGEGQGATFTLRLPSGEGAKPVQLPAVAEAANLPLRDSSKLRVMVVDDNIDAADGLTMLLELSGHEIRTAYGGAQALDIAREFRPDIVFLDIGMPQMDGYEVAQRLRRDLKLDDTVVVAVTGWGTAEDKRKTQAAGFNHHLTKPVDQTELLQLIDETDSRQQRSSSRG